MSSTRPVHVTIVGLGFSGVALLLQLLKKYRACAHAGLFIHVVNPQDNWARGVAYQTTDSPHLLNVPAGRMSVDPDEPDDFLNYLRTVGLGVDSSYFASRSLYGEYLEARYQKAISELPSGIQCIPYAARAINISVTQSALTAIDLDNGLTLYSDFLVLACGQGQPDWPRECRDTAQAQPERCIVDVWSCDLNAVAKTAQRILILGTGLSMYDVTLDLNRRGFQGEIVALSRRGLVAQAHRDHASLPSHELAGSFLNQTPLNMLRAVRGWIRRAPEQDWREVLNILRPWTPKIWQAWSVKQRTQFLRHVRSYWDTHRHRCAAPVFEKIQKLINDGRLTIMKGRLRQLTLDGQAHSITAMIQKVDRTVSIGPFDFVINCTGYGNLINQADSLLAQLNQAGWIEPEPLSLGMRTHKDYRVSQAHPIYYLGPLLRAQFWEATAVPELRSHAQHLACQLVAEIDALQNE